MRPARVTAREGDELLVMARPLAVEDGVLRFGEERPERILAAIDGRGFVDGAQPGDWVAVHWGWACDVLGPRPPRGTRGRQRGRRHPGRRHDLTSGSAPSVSR